MARAKTPAWQLFEYVPKENDDGTWIARSYYNDDAGIRHAVKRSARKKGALKLAMQRAVAEAKERSEQLKEEAERLKKEAEEAREAPVLTLAEVAESWLERKRPAPVQIDERLQSGTPPTRQIRMQTWISYADNLRNHVLPELGHFALIEVRTPHLEEAIHGMYDNETGEGYRTAEMAKQVLSQIMDYAVRQGHRLDNPVRFVSKVPSRHKVPVKLPTDTLAAVQDAVRTRVPEPGIGGPRPTSRLSDVVLLLQGTGMRVGEGLGIRWDDVQIKRAMVLVTVSGTLIEKGGFYRQIYPKSSKSYRTLQLTNPVLLEMFRRRYTDKSETRTNAVFPTRNGTFMRLSNFRTALKEAMKAAGLSEKITPHTFRSTVGSGVAETFNYEAAQKQLGHSSPETTRKHYVQLPDLVPDFSLGIDMAWLLEDMGKAQKGSGPNSNSS
ncbi:tyrosine-type recombinase/integrase [Pseudarthrobacter oxydans]|uniref:tyrosine-type recombinase/integrase n=1 Tax=Pseudarthrobacter oxydans TaxID=1671 RepID=UPI001571F2AE|nr:tyrosine-type recombinase/integrase [Pseudarthrobacter oxydans]NSX38928.1 tyrosine-type recombinase/integrase [Pseudarthrobacter oxydans]